MAEFLNTNLVGIYLRAKIAEEEKRYGYSKDSSYGLMMVSSYAEWVLRISIIAVSCLQTLILRQNKQVLHRGVWSPSSGEQLVIVFNWSPISQDFIACNVADEVILEVKARA